MRPRGGVPGREIGREVRARGARRGRERVAGEPGAREASGTEATSRAVRGRNPSSPLPEHAAAPLDRDTARCWSSAPPLRSSAKMNLLLLVAINSFVPQLKEDIKIALRRARAPIDAFSLKAVSPCVAETIARYPTRVTCENTCAGKF